MFVFVLGFDSLFRRPRGAGADCSFPMMKERHGYNIRNYNTKNPSILFLTIPIPQIIQKRTELKMLAVKGEEVDDETRTARYPTHRGENQVLVVFLGKIG